jgi:hypothetical protein
LIKSAPGAVDECRVARQLAIAVALIAASGVLVAAMLLATQASGH